MADEFKHKTVGAVMTQAEYEAIGGHIFNSQAAGDILYASSDAQLSRLAKGSDGEVLELASGIPSWVAKGFSSKSSAYRGTSNQSIPTSSATRICLNAESFDVGSEFDISEKTGAADATEANKLHDADGGFASGDVGKWLWNTTDNTYTTIAAFVDSGELTLTDDIMVDGDNYIIYSSTFKAVATGYYLVTSSIWFVGLAINAKYVSRIKNNGTTIAEAANYCAADAQWPTSNLTQIVSLSADDVLELVGYHEHGSNRDVYAVAEGTYLSVHRLS